MITGPLRVKGYIEVNGYKYPSSPASASGYVLVSSGPNGDFYWGPPSASSVFSGTTDAVAEGGTNKYYTDARARTAATGDQSWLTYGGWAKNASIIGLSGVVNNKANETSIIQISGVVNNKAAQNDLIQVSGLIGSSPASTNIRFSSGIQYISAGLTANQTTGLTPGNKVLFDRKEAGNIALTNGVFTLNSGVIYYLEAYVSDVVSGTAQEYYKWYNSTTSQYIDSVVVSNGQENVELRILATGITTINASGTIAYIESINIFPEPTGTYHNSLAGIQGGKTSTYYHSDQPINSGDSPQFAQSDNFLVYTPPVKLGGMLFGSVIQGGAIAGLAGTFGDAITCVGTTPQNNPNYSPSILFNRILSNTYVSAGGNGTSNGVVYIGTAGYPSGFITTGISSGVGVALCAYSDLGTWFGKKRYSSITTSDFNAYRLTIEQTADMSGGIRVRGTNPVGNMLEITTGNQTLFKIDNTGVMTVGTIAFPNSIASSGNTLLSDGNRLIFAPKNPVMSIDVCSLGGGNYRTISDALIAASSLAANGIVTLNLYGTFQVGSTLDLTTHSNYSNVKINGNNSLIYSNHSGTLLKLNKSLQIIDLNIERNVAGYSVPYPASKNDGLCFECQDGTILDLCNIKITNFGTAFKINASTDDTIINGTNITTKDCVQGFIGASDPNENFTATISLTKLTTDSFAVDYNLAGPLGPRTTAFNIGTGITVTAHNWIDTCSTTAILNNNSTLISTYVAIQSPMNLLLGDNYYSSGIIINDNALAKVTIDQKYGVRCITANNSADSAKAKVRFINTNSTPGKIIKQVGNGDIVAYFDSFILSDIERDSLINCRVIGLDRTTNQYIIGTNKFPLGPGTSGQKLTTDGAGGVYWGA